MTDLGKRVDVSIGEIIHASEHPLVQDADANKDLLVVALTFGDHLDDVAKSHIYGVLNKPHFEDLLPTNSWRNHGTVLVAWLAHSDLPLARRNAVSRDFERHLKSQLEKVRIMKPAPLVID